MRGDDQYLMTLLPSVLMTAMEIHMCKRNLFLISLLSLGSIACSGARIISQDIGGGVLSLYGSESSMMEKAQSVMNAHCGRRGFSIVKRETVVVGQEQYTQTDYQDQAQVDAQNTGERVKETTGESVKSAEGESTAQRSNSAHRAQTSTQSTAKGQETTVSGVRQLTEHHLTYQCGQ